MPLTLLGTTTSPYVRKVRIVARAIDLPLELLDTRTPEGAARLAEVAPLGKVPVLLGGDPGVLPDSSLILAWLWANHEAALRDAGLRLDPADLGDRARQVVVEGALDAAINRFYLVKDGVADDGYVAKQRDRVHTALDWIATRVAFERPVGLAALSLGVTLDWMAFRSVVELERWPGLVTFRDAWTTSGLGTGTEPG